MFILKSQVEIHRLETMSIVLNVPLSLFSKIRRSVSCWLLSKSNFCQLLSRRRCLHTQRLDKLEEKRWEEGEARDEDEDWK